MIPTSFADKALSQKTQIGYRYKVEKVKVYLKCHPELDGIDEKDNLKLPLSQIALEKIFTWLGTDISFVKSNNIRKKVYKLKIIIYLNRIMSQLVKNERQLIFQIKKYLKIISNLFLIIYNIGC